MAARRYPHLWLAAAALLPLCARAAEPSAATDHWSLRPLRQPAPPGVGDTRWPRNPIDRFILARLESLQLRPSPEADRRTLIRRLSFDLLGLPPDPDRVDAFVRDERPDAYERLVGEMLDDPAYGERWARHWLDVVHYGETHGYDKDKPRPNAWPYRDYVIRSLNQDKPYARFVQEQLAGDVLFPGTRDGFEALGFIAAGPWDFIGHAEVPENKIDGLVARHLDRDDMVGNAIGTFMSLTIQCAQCHDHKFDPITQTDYYRLQAVFAALDRADLSYDLDPALHQRRTALAARRRTLQEQLADVDRRLNASGGRRVELLNRLIQEGRLGREAPERAEFGYHSAIEPRADVVKWVQVDLGASRAIDAVVVVGCHDTFNNIGAGFGFPPRYRIELSDDPGFARQVTVVVDRSGGDNANPGVTPQRFPIHGTSARFVRFTATRLAPRQNDFIFALAELQALDTNGRNMALGATVTALDSIEAAPRWGRENLTDGYYYGGIARRSPAELAELERERDAAQVGAGNARMRQRRDDLQREAAQVAADLARLPPPRVVYAGVVYTGSGAFRGTGPEGRPRTIHVLKRGDVTKPGPVVEPGVIEAVARVTGSAATFDLTAGSGEGQRRAALARWVTSPDNPLTWRSIVNRVWQYHLGRGLVDTPNDFGRMGQPPSHPELLDWLASEFRAGGGSLKQLHRLIVCSSTYRQVSSTRPGDPATRLDGNNVYLWRMNRRKLEAEAVRDAALAVAGRLDRTMGGPGFQDFVIEHPEHSPHYEYDKYDPDEPRTHRRSVYRFIVRSQPQPFMATLDCADPSMRVDKRNESLSPVQALTLLNNGFMLSMSRHFAGRAERLGSDLPARVDAAFRLVFGRLPSAEDRERLTEFARQHGLVNMCRVLLNLNEFVFVD